ncbi:hypothetical protein BXQ17_02665 [Polaribacter sp. BM10]|uniref:hypothetical protein n=1 Tax=Polaribacter sp. BM10 TaxID=1529069 RepID=UPI000989F242|nr:hypothetical protein [Polaribacter sp. BM10]AQS93041.1 hypothetical protein BXQ17_02665 [Polaribacter sp. BM10]
MNNKYKKLIASIALDAFGLIPVPFLDFLWAPISGYIMTKMYKGKEGKVAGIVSFLEEILPLDIIPTFTIMWVYSYIINKRKNEDLIEN